jgi:hypothetical protein
MEKRRKGKGKTGQRMIAGKGVKETEGTRNEESRKGGDILYCTYSGAYNTA